MAVFPMTIKVSWKRREAGQQHQNEENEALSSLSLACSQCFPLLMSMNWQSRGDASNIDDDKYKNIPSRELGESAPWSACTASYAVAETGSTRGEMEYKKVSLTREMIMKCPWIRRSIYCTCYTSYITRAGIILQFLWLLQLLLPFFASSFPTISIHHLQSSSLMYP